MFENWAPWWDATLILVVGTIVTAIIVRRGSRRKAGK